jgi:hypothetical protein
VIFQKLVEHPGLSRLPYQIIPAANPLPLLEEALPKNLRGDTNKADINSSGHSVPARAMNHSETCTITMSAFHLKAKILDKPHLPTIVNECLVQK